MRTAFAAFVFACAANAQAQAVWTGPAGGGMLSVQEATVLEPGHFALGIVGDNYDRDPLGLDIWDVRITWRLAIVSGLEFYGRYDISRAVSVPAPHPVPPPPLDIVLMRPIDWQAHQPPHAYRSIYWPMPHLGDQPSRVGDMTPGEYVFGLKALLATGDGPVPAVSACAQATIPGDMSPDALAKGSGTGEVEIGVHLAATWAVGRWSASANLGYTAGVTETEQSGDRKIRYNYPAPYDRHHHVDTYPLLRPHLFSAGLGTRYHVRKGISAIAEVSGWVPIYGKSTFTNVGASDGLIGVQASSKALSLTLGIRQHLFQQHNDQTLQTGPFAGALDLSQVPDQERRRYLASIGVDPDYHRPGAGLIVVDDRPGVPDPPGSRRIPDTYRTSTTGNTGVVAAVSLSF